MFQVGQISSLLKYDWTYPVSDKQIQQYLLGAFWMGGSYVTTFIFPLLELYMSKMVHLLLIMNPNDS